MRNIVDPGSLNGAETKQNFFPVPNATVSYWRSELHATDEYRSTKELPSECNIAAIIGAGLLGVSMAYHLKKLYEEKKQPKIVILEARKVCSGATGGNGGHMEMKITTTHSLIEKYGLELATEVWNGLARKVVEGCTFDETGLPALFETRKSRLQGTCRSGI